MQRMKVYFDNAASAPMRDESIAAMLRILRECYGNPSSKHQQGRAAAAELKSARESIAAALNTDPAEIYFTSGGTEANNLAIMGCAEQLVHKGRHIITSSIEHEAVSKPIEKLKQSGWEVTYLASDKSGVISAKVFNAELREDTVLASIMLVNNETGAINPIASYASEIKRRGLSTILHTDAVQALCKIPFTADSLGADLLTVSAHKLHGPKGAGALYIRSGVKLKPVLLGGGQEKGLRSGTEAIPSIAGLGEAVRLGMSELTQNEAIARDIREYISKRIGEELPNAVVIGSDGSPFILSLSLPGFKSEVMMNYLDSEGISVSNGAACKRGARSHVLRAMQLKPETIDGALRLSFSRYNTRKEADYFVDKLVYASKTLLKPL